ncbi:MAG: GNAT family N-acetyltransferase [Saprospiraceae bacterium]|nr:GNAT family N-acetyltransferase [Saprospiraceae bacterium]
MAKYKFKPFPLLTSTRLALKPFSAEDLPRVFDLRSSPEVAKYLDRPLMNDSAETEAYLEKMQQGVAMGQWIIWGIHFQQEGFVGSICLWNLSEEEKKADIGYELLPAFQGKGIMSEAIPLVIAYGFEEMQLDRITAEVHLQNLTSVALLKKYGFIVGEEGSSTLTIYTLFR